MAYALALLSAAVYGSADFLGGLASRRLPILAVLGASQAAGLLTVLAALPLLPDAHPRARDLAWGAGAGVFGAVGLGLLYRALAIGPMTLVAPVTAVIAAAVPLAAGLLGGERLGPLAAAGIAAAFVAIVLVSRGAADERWTTVERPSRSRVDAIASAIGAGLVIGFFLVALDRTAPSSGLWPLVAARVTSTVLVVPFVVTTAAAWRGQAGTLGLVAASGVLDMAANILYLLATHGGPLSIVATLVSLYPVSTVVLARLVLGERLDASQGLGVASALVSVVLIVAGRP